MKIAYFVKKHPRLSDTEFVEHWTTTHAQLASKMPGLLGYAINLPVSTADGWGRPVDGYATLTFASREEAIEAWASPDGRATAEDGTLFMTAAHGFMAEPVGNGPDHPGAAAKLVLLLHKTADHSDEEFVSAWRSSLTPVLDQLPGLVAHTTNAPSAEQRGPRPFDGYETLRFTSGDAARAAWETGQDAIVACLGCCTRQVLPLLTEERIVVAQ